MSKLTIDPPDRRVSVTEGSQNRGDELAERLFRNLQSERKIASEIKEKIFLGDVLVDLELIRNIVTVAKRAHQDIPYFEVGNRKIIISPRHWQTQLEWGIYSLVK